MQAGMIKLVKAKISNLAGQFVYLGHLETSRHTKKSPTYRLQVRKRPKNYMQFWRPLLKQNIPREDTLQLDFKTKCSGDSRFSF